MKIIIDVMSGDKAPLEHIRGAALAAEAYNVKIIVVGDEKVIKDVSAENEISIEKVTIVHAPSVIYMDDSPLSVVHDKRDSSMAIGLQMLAKGEGDAFVSSGNTGALVAGSTLIVKRIKGIRRAAIGTIIPFNKPLLLVDSGANIDVNSDNMVQFAQMGSVYMSKIYNISSPEVGLVNNGSESTKGTSLQLESYDKLSNASVNFIGNIEGSDIPKGKCDVLVTDGFTGNIILKFVEGMGKFMFSSLKELFLASPLSKLAYVFVKKDLYGFKKRFDASEHGGALILGITKPVIKAHGSSDARAIKNAVRQAISFADSNIISDITDIVSSDNDKSQK